MPFIPSPPPLPGFGLPLSRVPLDKTSGQPLFPSALDPDLSESNHRARLPAFTLRELEMVNLMNIVTDKPDWEVKVFDESIVEKWKEEAGVGEDEDEDGDSETMAAKGGEGGAEDSGDGGKSKAEDVAEEGAENEVVKNGNEDTNQEENGDNGGDDDADGDDDNSDDDEGEAPSFTEKMFQYCIDELRYKAELYKKSGFVRVFTADVVKSDTAITSDLQEALKAVVAPLENVPQNRKDWHPGSNEQVLDLVHPSLFPLVYGLSRILPNSITSLDDYITQCGAGEVIPSQDNVDSAYSKKFQWLPCDVDISGDTPKILSYINNLRPKEHPALYQVIEKILAKVIPLWNATLSPLREDKFPERITYSCAEYDDSAWEKYLEENGPKQGDEEGDDDFEDRQNDWETDHKHSFYIHPDVERDFSPQPVQKVDLKMDFSSTGLQVIVKLANIHLTPEKSEYAGGTWHIEGQLNEHICATAIYYYDVENISSTYLHFRSAVNSDHIQYEVSYDQNDNDWLRDIYGLTNWESCVQDLGASKLVKADLSLSQISFNIKFAHSILQTQRSLDTRRDWWAEMVLKSNVLQKLPPELRDLVVKDSDAFPIDLDRAKELREELMEERKEYVIGYQEHNFKSVSISLCEH
ncbi:hypothetical protein D9756_007047 [Leucocoprinus leucothites]|uniref:Uncharacterized protein n=1 Tax=Leucocoprinus leucothites TaxID=201217 RepID=A0A8H5D627_9AGAR|nr:hypothetical protein D9756_007047 [Leucoagaricus leucothites]